MKTFSEWMAGRDQTQQPQKPGLLRRAANFLNQPVDLFRGMGDDIAAHKAKDKERSAAASTQAREFNAAHSAKNQEAFKKQLAQKSQRSRVEVEKSWGAYEDQVRKNYAQMGKTPEETEAHIQRLRTQAKSYGERS